MEYLLDTANLDDIKKYNDYFPITGVTTNPSIVKKEGAMDFFQHMKSIRNIIGKEKTLHIQVTGSTYDEMLKEAEAILENVDDQVYIKVPTTLEGIKVMKELKKRSIHVTATAIYYEAQGFLAMEAGADFIAPYYNRMENMGIDSKKVIESFYKIISSYNYKTKILAASFKNVGQINQAFLAGAHTATMDPSILVDALGMPAIEKAVVDFNLDWDSIYGNKKIYEL